MVSQHKACLNVGAWEAHSVVNGPGERFVLWLQGCPLRCPGCFNQEFLPFVERYLLTVEELATRILSTPGIEGVTYTGGEPTVQAQGLVLLSERLREAGLSIVSYTGYNLETLQARNAPWLDRFLSSLDILIDGPYVREQAASLLWRGSRNQRIHFLSETYQHLAEQVDELPAEVELSVGQGSFTTTGTWPEGFLERLEEILN
jgi:anaerobic ribonucleoside-triphosphate reductase activating protein